MLNHIVLIDANTKDVSQEDHEHLLKQFSCYFEYPYTLILAQYIFLYQMIAFYEFKYDVLFSDHLPTTVLRATQYDRMPCESTCKKP